MDVIDTLKNPLVLGGGALIGVFMLMRGSSASAANAASAANVANPVVTSAAVQMNTAALGAQVELATVQAQYGAAIFNANVTDHANYLSYLTNIDNNNAVTRQTQITADAGVTNSLIAANTAIVVDASNNAARLGEAYQQTAQASIAANAQTKVAQYQYQAVKTASKNNLIGTIVGSIAKVATAGIGAAFGGPVGAGAGSAMLGL